ncbi:Uncharacterized conserved protein YbjT, contains NAD(P)-binding and DUF2867 domains [Parasphingorhabdus marina DSM 22363]|uniref:Uncharacterized conserved protein YbjT, contains NAD(P)-binding and DUF2867 domains n=1 Tax=Parasphingorhabdus marina DSM 22363 TaxID=1123272 RepID=A0A1N6D9J6_9SPHN|nr:NmrA family NAD(P)-binding protein [Parasphingorhabdus marina]SIN67356.1 Uncharacterized conserved protein YbjT, contains NAD(P)-binding and DUF2867 domains [Parasphingorhabdus marina DSM 22363]
MNRNLLLLTGANGRTGRAILKAMVDQQLPVRAFIRDSRQAEELEQLGASECVSGDMTDPGSIAAAMKGVSKVLHIGPPMHPEELPITQSFIKAARTEGVDHFIYYSVMHPLRRDVRHHRLKLDAEEALIESGLPYTILQPSRYMQHLVPIWKNVTEDGVHAMPFDVTKKFNVVDLNDLAAACAVVASSDDHLYATYELAGPEALSQEDMAATISDVIGREVTAQAVPLDKVAEKARAAGADADRIEQMLVMNKHYDEYGFRGNPNILQYLIGRPACHFRAYVTQLASTP